MNISVGRLPFETPFTTFSHDKIFLHLLEKQPLKRVKNVIKSIYKTTQPFRQISMVESKSKKRKKNNRIPPFNVKICFS